MSREDYFDGEMYRWKEKDGRDGRSGRSTTKNQRYCTWQHCRENPQQQEKRNTYFRQHLCVSRIRHSATIAWCRRGEQGWGNRVRQEGMACIVYTCVSMPGSYSFPHVEVRNETFIYHCTAIDYSSTLAPAGNYGSPRISIWNKHTQRAIYPGTVSI